MHFTYILCALSIFQICAESKVSIPWPPKSATMIQKIDHFNYANWRNHSTFTQRYLYDDSKWDHKGPIFFYCGNEGSIESFWNNTGFMFEIASSFNALIVFGEHRYYGKSLPFDDPKITFTQPYIQFLSIEQALVDFAYMINHIKETFNATKSPFFTFGGSYGGILAAYMRVRFPHMVEGAIASSAPVYWTVGLKDMHGFFEATTKDFEEADPKCVPALKEAYAQIIQLSSNHDGLSKISQEMSLCKTMQTTADLDHMLRWTRNAFVMMSMMDYPYPTNFMAQLPGNPVNVSCEKAIEAAKTSPIAALKAAINVIYPLENSCFPYKDQYIPCADITGCGLGPDAWAWDFQSCTEIHLYDGSNHTSGDMFPDIPLTREAADHYCLNQWGVQRSEKQMATFFGPGVWEQIGNIVFANGRRDPWMNGGILSDLGDTVKTVIVEGGAHHLDLRSSNKLDPQSVLDARKMEILQLSTWINNWHARQPNEA